MLIFIQTYVYKYLFECWKFSQPRRCVCVRAWETDLWKDLVEGLQNKLHKATLGVTGGGLLGKLPPVGGNWNKTITKDEAREMGRETNQVVLNCFKTIWKSDWRLRVEEDVSPESLGKVVVVDVTCKTRTKQVLTNIKYTFELFWRVGWWGKDTDKSWAMWNSSLTISVWVDLGKGSKGKAGRVLGAGETHIPQERRHHQVLVRRVRAENQETHTNRGSHRE